MSIVIAIILYTCVLYLSVVIETSPIYLVTVLTVVIATSSIFLYIVFVFSYSHLSNILVSKYVELVTCHMWMSQSWAWGTSLGTFVGGRVQIGLQLFF